MKAGDVRCPRCQTGFVDIDPEHELSSRDGPVGYHESRVMGTCAEGHLVGVRIVLAPRPGDPPLVVEVHSALPRRDVRTP
jgi:hypothetical protein